MKKLLTALLITASATAMASDAEIKSTTAVCHPHAPVLFQCRRCGSAILYAESPAAVL